MINGVVLRKLNALDEMRMAAKAMGNRELHESGCTSREDTR